MAKISIKNKAKKSDIVKIKNDLIEGFVKSNNIVALKILFFLAYDNTKISHLVRVKLKTKEICDYCNINEQTLKRNIKQMQKTTISWTDESAENYVCLIPKARFAFDGVLEIEMFGEILEMILDVKSKYTMINTEQLMLLKSKHSVRMLLLLEMISGFDKDVPKLKKYTLDELNLLFGTNYKRLGQFEQEILKKSESDLNKFSTKSYTYEIMYDKKPFEKGRPKAIGIIIYLKDNIPTC